MDLSEASREDVTIGPITLAYYRKNKGWIYADEPTKVRFDPYYWRLFSEWLS